MKIKLLMVGLLTLVSAITLAQKGELNNAKEQYESFTPLSLYLKKFVTGLEYISKIIEPAYCEKLKP